MTRLHIIEESGKAALIKAVESFAASHEVILESVKFQRNLFYAGIGSSAGHTPGSTQDLSHAKLDELWVAFLLWKDG
jgi:hypothetical protein